MNGSSKRALFLTPALPAIGGNGLAMRAGLLLEGIARAFEVDVVVVPVFGVPVPRDDLVRRLAASVHVLALGSGGPTVAEFMDRLAAPVGRQRARLLQPLPECSRVLATPVLQQTVAKAVARSDVVVVLRSYLTPLLDATLDGVVHPPIAVDVDDIESITQRRQGFTEQAVAFERLESYYLPLMNAVATCSSVDADHLIRRYELPSVAVIPNAVRPPTGIVAPSGLLDLVFVGNLSYAPNVEGAQWLCRRVLPLLGDVRIAIVGSSPPPDVRALSSDPRVTVVADPVDLDPWYAGASIAVVPVLRGGGSRIKLLEAFAHGRAVVATSIGAEGVPWSAEVSPIMRADTPEEFASSCRALLGNPDEARRRASAGLELVQTTATVAVVAPTIERFLRTMLSR